MACDHASAIEHGLRTLQRPRHRGLHQQALGEGIVLLQLRQHGVALLPVAHPPDAGARGAERGLDEERIGPRRNEFIGRTHELGSRLRYVQPRQQFGEAGLALHLLERRETGERDTEASGKPLGRGGEQIGLLMHRQQRVDPARFDRFDHRLQIAVRIGARRRRPMERG